MGNQRHIVVDISGLPVEKVSVPLELETGDREDRAGRPVADEDAAAAVATTGSGCLMPVTSVDVVPEASSTRMTLPVAHSATIADPPTMATPLSAAWASRVATGDGTPAHADPPWP